MIVIVSSVVILSGATSTGAAAGRSGWIDQMVKYMWRHHTSMEMEVRN